MYHEIESLSILWIPCAVPAQGIPRIEGERAIGGTRNEKSRPTGGDFDDPGGADGDRTHDFSIANAALSQLSYGPTPGSGWYLRGRWGASGSMG
jgi:hypothetical protein